MAIFDALTSISAHGQTSGLSFCGLVGNRSSSCSLDPFERAAIDRFRLAIGFAVFFGAAIAHRDRLDGHAQIFVSDGHGGLVGSLWQRNQSQVRHSPGASAFRPIVRSTNARAGAPRPSRVFRGQRRISGQEGRASASWPVQCLIARDRSRPERFRRPARACSLIVPALAAAQRWPNQTSTACTTVAPKRIRSCLRDQPQTCVETPWGSPRPRLPQNRLAASLPARWAASKVFSISSHPSARSDNKKPVITWRPMPPTSC